MKYGTCCFVCGYNFKVNIEDINYQICENCGAHIGYTYNINFDKSNIDHIKIFRYHWLKHEFKTSFVDDVKNTQDIKFQQKVEQIKNNLPDCLIDDIENYNNISKNEPAIPMDFILLNQLESIIFIAYFLQIYGLGDGYKSFNKVMDNISFYIRLNKISRHSGNYLFWENVATCLAKIKTPENEVQVVKDKNDDIVENKFNVFQILQALLTFMIDYNLRKDDNADMETLIQELNKLAGSYYSKNDNYLRDGWNKALDLVISGKFKKYYIDN